MPSEKTITTHTPINAAYALVERSGITVEKGHDRRGREWHKWIVPEEARLLVGFSFTWALDEALATALAIIAIADEPEMLVWP